jgi:hypothetical protein
LKLVQLGEVVSVSIGHKKPLAHQHNIVHRIAATSIQPGHPKELIEHYTTTNCFGIEFGQLTDWTPWPLHSAGPVHNFHHRARAVHGALTVLQPHKDG